MRKYKTICILLLIIVGFLSELKAQTKTADDLKIAPYIAASEDGIPDAAQAELLNKLTQLLAKNGVVETTGSMFILTANATVLTKDVTPTAPVMYAYTFQISLYLGNGIDGVLFATHSLNAKGIGTNETKAYISAFSNLTTNSPEITDFLAKGKRKIIDYYNAKCTTIIAEANKLEKLNKYNEALNKLSAIPSTSSCYQQSAGKIAVVYKKAIDFDCRLKLSEAQQIWNANPNADGANNAAKVLREIDPSSGCFSEVKALGKTIATKMNANDAREWTLFYERKVGLEKDRIQAIKEVGKAYGNGQPKVLNYNTKGWW